MACHCNRSQLLLFATLTIKNVKGFVILCTARCILMLWNYGRALQSCKCPICARRICKLTPEASLSLRREEEVVEALKKVERYNRLYVGGARGLVMVC